MNRHKLTEITASHKRVVKSKGILCGLVYSLLYVSFILIKGGLNATNIRAKNIGYWRSDIDSRNADFYINLILKEYPSDLTTFYAENIIFSFKNGWTPREQYLNGPFDMQVGDLKRFVFRLNGYTTIYLNQGIPIAATFAYYKTDSLLNVDEWIKRDSCPFKRIQLQGLSANVKVELPDTLDISFPCNLNSIKVCKRYDPFFGGCAEYAP